MSKVVGIGNLSGAVQKLLAEYGEDAADVIREVAPEIGKAARQDLQAVSPRGTTSKPYSRGWAMQTQNTRLGINVVVHNKSKPGLTHLLEFGHALRNGGRTAARPHIAAVNDRAQEQFVKAVTERLEEIGR